MRHELFVLVICALTLGLFEPVSAAQIPAKPAGSSRSLIQQAWTAFEAKDFDRAMTYVEECIATFDLKALDEQKSLKGPIPKGKANLYWELNDVAVAKFIKAKVYLDKNEQIKAKEVLTDIIDNYSYAISYEPKGGWYWTVADAAKRLSDDLKSGAVGASGSSNVLKKKAADAYQKGQYADVMVFADKCIGLYRDSALVQQKQLTKYPDDKHIARYWALNDVGTCYYLAAMSALAFGDRQKADTCFRVIKQELFYASYWDPNGWYMKVTDLVADKEKEMLKAVQPDVPIRPLENPS